MLPLLQGIRILDFTTIVLGPYATQTLGDLGADVIKIEPLQGDLFRAVPPGRSRSMGAGFMGFNRNKRSLAIDLKRPEAREVLARLVMGADAVVHNMRPKAAESLGIGYAQLQGIRPDLVYAFAAGYDQSGPKERTRLRRHHPGRGRRRRPQCQRPGPAAIPLDDSLRQSRRPASRDRSGRRAGVSGADGPGQVHRGADVREHRGVPDVGAVGGETFVPALGPTGYDRLAAPNRKPYATSDGYMAILPYNSAHWAAFFELIGRPELAQSPQVQDPVLRSENVDALYAVIAEVAPTRTTAEWQSCLRAADIPCARVNSVGDLLHDAHLAATGFFQEYDHPTEGRLRGACPVPLARRRRTA